MTNTRALLEVFGAVCLMFAAAFATAAILSVLL